MEDKPLQIVDNNEFVIVSKEYCKNIIQKLCVISFSSSLIIKAYNPEDDNYKFSKKNLRDILSGLDFKFNSFSSERASSEKIRKKIIEQYSFMLPFYYKRKNIKEKCLKLAETFNNIFTFTDYLFSDEKIMMRELELLCSFIKVDYDFYYLVDLIAAKDDMVENLKCIYDSERVAVFEKQYNLAIENLDASALKNLLESTQNLILKHWEEYLTNIDDYKPGNPFRFLCHSMDEVFEGNFHSDIVSMSLLTEQLHDVFNDEYGFIFDASNIIAADSSDMFINNYAESDNNVLYYSTIKRILAPERIERDCLRLKKEEENSTGKKIYSEVAKRGLIQ